MKKIELTKDNIEYFHFTHTGALSKIEEVGLQPQIGSNAMGAEDTSKVFFSKGIDGVAKCVDVWIRWRMVEFHKINTLQKFIDEEVNTFKPKKVIEKTTEKGEVFKDLNDDEKAELSALYQRAQDRFTEFVASGGAETPEARAYAYEDMFRNWKNKTYLSLNLIEGENRETAHFIRTLDGEDKKRQFSTGREIDKKYLEYMYSEFEYDTNQMDSWNLHTFPSDEKYKGKGVETDNILGVISVDGKTDGLSVAKKIYELAPNREKLTDFKQWLDYCALREKENITQQETIKKGRYIFTIDGTQLDRELFEAFLEKDIKSIKKLIEKGTDPNVPIMCDKYGKKTFYSEQDEIVEQTTMPMLAHYITKRKNVTYAQDEIDFINGCFKLGANLSCLNNPFVLPKESMDRIEDGKVKDYIGEVGNLANNSGMDSQEESDEIYKYVRENVKNNQQVNYNDVE